MEQLLYDSIILNCKLVIFFNYVTPVLVFQVFYPGTSWFLQSTVFWVCFASDIIIIQLMKCILFRDLYLRKDE